MKKSFVLLTALFLFLTATCSLYAQFGSKGVTEMGGAISYSSSTAVANGEAADESTSLLNFMPYVNYFITNNFSLGISPGINIVKLAGSDDSITNLMLFAVPGYTFSSNGNVFPFVEAWIGYTAVTSNADPLGSGEKLDLSGISYGGKGGIKLLVGKSGLLNIGVSYTMYTMNPKGADKRNGYNSLALAMGFSVFIN